VISEKATRAVDRVHARRDGLVEGYGAGTAMVRSAGLVWFSVLSFGLLALLSLSVCYLVLLLEGCTMALLVHLPLPFTIAVAVEGAAESLGIHRPNKPVVYPSRSARG